MNKVRQLIYLLPEYDGEVIGTNISPKLMATVPREIQAIILEHLLRIMATMNSPGGGNLGSPVIKGLFWRFHNRHYTWRGIIKARLKERVWGVRRRVWEGHFLPVRNTLEEIIFRAGLFGSTCLSKYDQHWYGKLLDKSNSNRRRTLCCEFRWEQEKLYGKDYWTDIMMRHPKSIDIIKMTWTM